MVVVGFCAAVRADLVIYDHFENPPAALDAAKWAPWGSTSPNVTVSGSVVTLSAGSNAWCGMDSTAVFGQGTYEFKYAGGTGSQLFGFEDAATGLPYIAARNDILSGARWALFVNDGSGANNGAVFSAPVAGDIFDLTWGAAGFELSRGGSVISSVSVPVTAQLSLFTSARKNCTISLDYVGTVTSTPEPSTLVLLSAGLIGLLAYAWRKRR